MSESNETRWHSASGLDWIERDGRFTGLYSADQYFSFSELATEQLSAKVCSAPQCPQGDANSALPPDFRFCPDCGGQLQPAFPSDDLLWSYPSPEGDGLLNTEAVDIHSTMTLESRELGTPDAPDLVVVVAGRPRRLLALDKMNSTLFAFDRRSRRWEGPISSPAHFDDELPDWSWSICASDQGIALPGTQGPIIARLDELGRAILIGKTPASIGRLLAGPGRLGERIFFLFPDSQGALNIGIYDPRTDKWQDPVPVQNSPAGFGPGDAFAAPVSKLPSLFWAGVRGYVGVRESGSNVEASWRNWSEDFSLEPRIRPMWCQSTFWQFGSRGSTPQFEKLAFRGPPATHEVNGTHLTAGEVSFTSGMQMYVRPWDETSTQLVGSGDSFLMPVCGLKGLTVIVADCGFDPAMRRVDPNELTDENLIGPAKPAKLLIRTGDGMVVDLNHVARISSLAQLQAIVFDRQLLIYDSRASNFTAWQINNGT